MTRSTHAYVQGSTISTGAASSTCACRQTFPHPEMPIKMIRRWRSDANLSDLLDFTIYQRAADFVHGHDQMYALGRVYQESVFSAYSTSPEKAYLYFIKYMMSHYQPAYLAWARTLLFNSSLKTPCISDQEPPRSGHRGLVTCPTHVSMDVSDRHRFMTSLEFYSCCAWFVCLDALVLGFVGGRICCRQVQG